MILQRKAHFNPKERFAIEYLFFRFPAFHSIIFLPTLMGLVFYVINSKLVLQGENKLLNSTQVQKDLIISYLTVAKITLIILTSFFICYRWSTMEKNRNYGYWLTQGVRREAFYIKTIVGFLVTGLTGILAGLSILIIYDGFYLHLAEFSNLFILLVINVITILSLSILIGELIENPELAMIVNNIFFGLLTAYAISRDGIMKQIFFGDLVFDDEPFITTFLYSGIVMVIITSFGLIIHKNKDFDL